MMKRIPAWLLPVAVVLGMMCSLTLIAQGPNPVTLFQIGPSTLLTTTMPVSGTLTANVGTTNGLGLDSSLTTIDTDLKANIVLAAGTHVIGHVVADSGSTTAVTGNVASTVADGANVVLGAKADAKSNATDTTPITLMQVLKQVSASVQAPPSQAVTNAGTFLVQAGLPTTADTNTGSPGSSTLRFVPADGLLECAIVSAASTNSTNCKGSAGNFFGYDLYNTTTTVYYLRLYNTSSAPTCSSSTGFIRSIPIPPAAAAGQVSGGIRTIPMGVAYGTGVSYCLTGGSSSTDNTNAAVGVFGTVMYR